MGHDYRRADNGEFEVDEKLVNELLAKRLHARLGLALTLALALALALTLPLPLTLPPTTSKAAAAAEKARAAVDGGRAWGGGPGGVKQGRDGRPGGGSSPKPRPKASRTAGDLAAPASLGSGFKAGPPPPQP